MYTRFVECRVKPESKDDAINVMRSQILPTLKNSPGFMDLVGLTSDTDTNVLVTISFWKTKQDAERYYRDHYPHNLNLIRTYLIGEPTLRTFNVDTSTMHHIAAGKAA
jgi:heme-degrading monooxygenase HmoA